MQSCTKGRETSVCEGQMVEASSAKSSAMTVRVEAFHVPPVPVDAAGESQAAIHVGDGLPRAHRGPEGRLVQRRHLAVDKRERCLLGLGVLQVELSAQGRPLRIRELQKIIDIAEGVLLERLQHSAASLLLGNQWSRNLAVRVVARPPRARVLASMRPQRLDQNVNELVEIGLIAEAHHLSQRGILVETGGSKLRKTTWEIICPCVHRAFRTGCGRSKTQRILEHAWTMLRWAAGRALRWAVGRGRASKQSFGPCSRKLPRHVCSTSKMLTRVGHMPNLSFGQIYG